MDVSAIQEVPDIQSEVIHPSNLDAHTPEAERKQEDMKETSLVKIQRLARKKRAERLAKEEQSWKIFCDLDTIAEAEMLRVGKFMNTLLTVIPTLNPLEATDEDDNIDCSDDDDYSIGCGVHNNFNESTWTGNIDIAQIKISGAGTSKNSFLTRKSSYRAIDILQSAESKHSVASEIIEVCRLGKKVSREVVVDLITGAIPILRDKRNITFLDVVDGEKITVVGDIHGQVHDLLYIIDEMGMPTNANKFIFNGDFVDRGENGVEVMCILLSLFISEPTCIALNRGNHEDEYTNRCYGFCDECIRKYDEEIFMMFAELFKYLPICSLVAHSVFVIHGGLFMDRTVTLEDIEQIDRTDLVTHVDIPYPENTEGMAPEDQWREFYRELLRDALWSDPMVEEGMADSFRGVGVLFGPDVAKQFMDTNGISMIIRSHECVRLGFEYPFVPTSNPGMCPDNLPQLCTIFSASNYSNGDNEGAYMVIMPHRHSKANPIRNTNLFFSVHHFKIAPTSAASLTDRPDQSYQSSLRDLIIRRRNALLLAFEAVDLSGSGLVTRLQWSEIMQLVTTIKMRWLSIINSIAPANSVTPTAVDYKAFLLAYPTHVYPSGLGRSSPSTSPPSSGIFLTGEGQIQEIGTGSEISGLGASGSLFDGIYLQRSRLESVFSYFDTDDDGVVSCEEFREGCERLNLLLPEEQKLLDIDDMIAVIDFDGSGSISVNEFFEANRIIDVKQESRTSSPSPTPSPRPTPSLGNDEASPRSAGVGSLSPAPAVASTITPTATDNTGTGRGTTALAGTLTPTASTGTVAAIPFTGKATNIEDRDGDDLIIRRSRSDNAIPSSSSSSSSSSSFSLSSTQPTAVGDDRSGHDTARVRASSADSTSPARSTAFSIMSLLGKPSSAEPSLHPSLSPGKIDSGGNNLGKGGSSADNSKAAGREKDSSHEQQQSRSWFGSLLTGAVASPRKEGQKSPAKAIITLVDSTPVCDKWIANRACSEGRSTLSGAQKKSVQYRVGTAPPRETRLALSIASHQTSGKHVVYTLHCLQYGRLCSIEKRYRDFEALHRGLVAEQHEDIQMPQLPQKRWLQAQRWTNRLDQDFNLTRRFELENYLRVLVRVPGLLDRSSSWREFLLVDSLAPDPRAQEAELYALHRDMTMIRYPPEYESQYRDDPDNDSTADGTDAYIGDGDLGLDFPHSSRSSYSGVDDGSSGSVSEGHIGHRNSVTIIDGKAMAAKLRRWQAYETNEERALNEAAREDDVVAAIVLGDAETERVAVANRISGAVSGDGSNTSLDGSLSRDSVSRDSVDSDGGVSWNSVMNSYGERQRRAHRESILAAMAAMSKSKR